MSTFPGSPRVLKGGIVLLDPNGSKPPRVIALQYNPDSLSRTLQAQGAGPDSGDHVEVLRLKGPPIETLKLDAEIDAADQLEFPTQNDLGRNTATYGIYPQLATLEAILYPPSATLVSNNGLASFGTLEIAPVEAPLTVFVFNKSRVVPVRITEFAITEEAFDPNLNPIRAKVSLSLRVLSTTDLGFNQRGSGIYLMYQQTKEQLSTLNPGGQFGDLGITKLP